jgi:signal transduction histidine kinase
MGHFLKVSLKEPVYFDPEPVLAGVFASPEVQAKAQCCALNVKLEPGLPQILSDPISFGEVVRNLLDNAFDATPAGGRITVRAYRKNRSGFVLSVRDTGKGISNPDKGQLFRPFFTTKEKGMGLGLPFIKRVMDNAGGKVEVHSRVGKGTIFRLTFNFREREPNP